MGENPLVSVIMIFLDADRFMEEAIRSVLDQTYRNWELILVDDGSADSSPLIAKRYAGRDPGRIRCLAHPGGERRGMSASRNLGISDARGDYVAFLDADDVWLPTKLERQVGILQSQPVAGMVYGPTQWWYSWAGLPEHGRRDYIHELGVAADTILEPPTLLSRYLRAEGFSPCTCSVLVRRHLVQEVGGFEEHFPDLYEDQVFFAKVSLAAPVYVDSVCSARYRRHVEASDVDVQLSSGYRTARRRFLTWVEGFLAERGMGDPEVRRTLRAEKRRILRPAWWWRMGRATSVRWRGVADLLKLRALGAPGIRHLRALAFRRLQPLRRGMQTGTPIVRRYWAEFLEAHRDDIRGRGLEIGTTSTLRLYGGDDLTSAEAIDLSPHGPDVTVTSDLSRADHVPPGTYDCFILPFTTHVIYDIEAALYHAVRILKPKGVLLVNFPCVDYYFADGLDMGTGQPLFLHRWFTPIQVEDLLHRIGLEREDYGMEVYGNLFSRIAYQLNMPAEELTRREIDHRDRGHPLLICVRAVKPGDWSAARPIYRDPWLPDGTPARWNPETGHYG